MAKLRIGIVGCGKIADFHARAIQELDSCRLIACCGQTTSHVLKFSSRFEIKSYFDVEEMIKSEHLDAVTICTPHPSHALLAIASLKAGAHVLVEKPLALTVAQCDKMIRTANKNHLLLGTLVQRRFYKPCLRIKEAIDNGLIGRPILGEAVMLGWRGREYYDSDPWRGSLTKEGGGVLINQAPHQIDLLNWYMGEIESIQGHVANYNHPYIEVEDSAAAVIRYKSGAMATVLASNSQNPALYGRVHIFGDNGRCAGVQTDGGAMFIAGQSEIEEPPVTDLWTVDDDPQALSRLAREDADYFLSRPDKMIYFHKLSIENFVNAILGKASLMADGLAGRQTVEVFEALYHLTYKNKNIWRSSQHQPATF